MFEEYSQALSEMSQSGFLPSVFYIFGKNNSITFGVSALVDRGSIYEYSVLTSINNIKYFWNICDITGILHGPTMSILTTSTWLYRCTFLLCEARFRFHFMQPVHVMWAFVFIIWLKDGMSKSGFRANLVMASGEARCFSGSYLLDILKTYSVYYGFPRSNSTLVIFAAASAACFYVLENWFISTSVLTFRSAWFYRSGVGSVWKSLDTVSETGSAVAFKKSTW